MNSSEPNLASQVSELRSKLKAIAEKPSKDLADFSLARQIEDHLVLLERQLGLEKGEPVAFRLEDWPAKVAKYDRLLGVINVGRSLTVWHEVSRVKSTRYAFFDCEWCCAVRREWSSETGFFNHPLYRHGLDGLGGFVVRNSEWKQNLGQRLNLKGDGTGKWSTSEHYLFVFEDDIVEFIADGLRFLKLCDSLADAQQQVRERLSVLPEN